MKYLFFDLECSNCFGGNNKVCEFGAIITDEKFNIIKKMNIPMNPGSGRACRFDMSIYKRDPEFDWAYDFDYYFSCPKFYEFYKEIKAIMEAKDTIVFGYAVDNDIRYLNSACKQYNLEPITYIAYDVQLIKRAYKKEKQEIRGLKGAFIELCGSQKLLGLVPHLSMDDARMTMMVFKQICENMKMSAGEIMDLCDDLKYDSVQYIKEYEFKQKDKLLHPEKYKRRRKSKDECQIAWGNFYREYESQLKKEESIGRKATISSELKSDMGTLNEALNYIKTNNLVPCDKVSGSDYLIVLDDDDRERLLSKLKYPFNGQIVKLHKNEVRGCLA